MIGSHPGLTGWPGSRVGRVFPGQFPSGFLPPPGSVPGPSRPGPGSTSQAGPGFKTLVDRAECRCWMREEGSVVQLEAIDGHREWKRIGTEWRVGHRLRCGSWWGFFFFFIHYPSINLWFAPLFFFLFFLSDEVCIYSKEF